MTSPIPPTGKDSVQVQGSTVYVLNNDSLPANLWYATVYPGFDDEGRRFSDEACREVAHQIAAALASSVAKPSGLEHIKEPYTVEEIFAKWESNQYGAEHLLQHALLHLRAKPETQEPDGARRWLEVVQQKADSARENVQALRKFPGSEAEARARELAATYLVETAQLMAMDEVHAEMLSKITDGKARLRTVMAELEDVSSTGAAEGAKPAVQEEEAFEQLCREHGIAGTAAARQCEVFWRAGARFATNTSTPAEAKPHAWTTEDALREVGKWLNERPNRPLDLTAVAELCAAVQQSAPQAEAVFLVATGEVYEGQETYTRHEGAPPPLCDFETLYATPTAPTPAEAPAGQGEARDIINTIIRDVSELDGVAMDDSQALAVSVDELRVILERNIATPLPAQVQPAEQVGEREAFMRCNWGGSAEYRAWAWQGWQARAAATLASSAQQQAVSEWQRAIDDELICCHLGTTETFPDPREALRQIINWHVAVSLDPAVSSAAQALIDQGKQQPVSAEAIESAAREDVARDIDWTDPANLGATAVQRAAFRRGARWAIAALAPPLEDEAKRIMSMTEREVDAELRAMGIDPDEAAIKGEQAVKNALDAIARSKATGTPPQAPGGAA